MIISSEGWGSVAGRRLPCAIAFHESWEMWSEVDGKYVRLKMMGVNWVNVVRSGTKMGQKRDLGSEKKQGKHPLREIYYDRTVCH